VKCVVFVTVRTASSRLPKKALLRINNKPLIKILIDRIKRAPNFPEVIVCTTCERSDDKLTKLLRENNVEVFRGSNKDTLFRLYSAAKKYNIKEFVVVEGDDFFCDLSLIEKTCNKLLKSDYEFLLWENLPFGVSPFGIKTNKLGLLNERKTTKNTETGWGKFIIDSGFFKVGRLRLKNKELLRPEIRLSIDYKEDFELAKKIYQKLPEEFSLIDIIHVLNENPEWHKINETTKNKYKENFEKKRQKWFMKKRV